MKNTFVISLLVLLQFSISVSAYSAPDPSTLWLFEDEGSTYIDNTFRGNDATPGPGGNEPVLTRSHPLLGNALELDGTNYATVNHSADVSISGDFTLAFWIRRPDDSSNGMILTKQGDDVNFGFDYRLSIKPEGHLLFQLKHNSTANPNQSAGYVSVNQWTHITITHHSATQELKWYANGNNTKTVQNVGDVRQATGNLIIGATDVIGANGFNGGIDNLQFFDSVLSDLQIAEIADPDTRVASFDMNESLSDTSTTDQTDYHNNGTFGDGDFSPIREFRDATNGNALRFDGNDYVSVPNKTIVSAYPYGLTFSADIFRTGTDVDTIVSKTDPGTAYSYRFNVKTDGYLNLTASNGVGVKNFSGFYVPPNDWTHVEVALDLEAHKIIWFMNGSIKKARFFTENLSINETVTPVLIGAVNDTGANGFDGLIDNVEINNHPVINTEEVAPGQELELELPDDGKEIPTLTGSISNYTFTIKNTSASNQNYEILVIEENLLVSDTVHLFNATLAPEDSTQIDVPIDTSQPGSHRLSVEVITLTTPNKTVAKGNTLINVWDPFGNTYFDNVENFFGIMTVYIHNTANNYSEELPADAAIMQQMGSKVGRVLIKWNLLEPSQDEYISNESLWEDWDFLITTLNENGISPAPFLWTTPEWAYDREARKDAEDAIGKVSNSPPAIFQDYYDVMADLVERYDSTVVPTWEIWNEPYLGKNWWYPDEATEIAKYVELLGGVYSAIKDVDPYTQVIIGGQGPGLPNFSTEVMQQAGDFYDIYAFHSHGYLEQHLTSLTNNTWSVETYDPDKKNTWWCNETGVNINLDDQVSQSTTMIKKAAISRYNGLKNFMWFVYRDAASASNDGNTFEMIDLDNGGLRPSVVAYNAMTSLLHDTVPHAELAEISDSNDSDDFGYSFYREGEQVIVLWNEKDEANTVNIPIPSSITSVKQYNVFGSESVIPVSGGNLAVTLDFDPAIYVLTADTQQSTFFSIHEHDGYILESGQYTDVGGYSNSSDTTKKALRIGDGPNNEQYRTLVSFDTSSLPAGAIVVGARLELTRGDTIGGDPFNPGNDPDYDFSVPQVSLRIDGFGGNPLLENSDFEAAPTVTSNTGQLIDDGIRATARLNSHVLDAIEDENTDIIQLRIEFRKGDNDNGIEDYASYYSGYQGNQSARPQLIVDYVLP